MDRGAWRAAVYGVTRVTHDWTHTHPWPEDKSRAATATAKSLQPCPTLRPHRWQPTRLPRPWESPGKNTGVGCHFLLQGIFPTQGSYLDLLHCMWILYHLTTRKAHLWWLLGLIWIVTKFSWLSLLYTGNKHVIKLACFALVDLLLQVVSALRKIIFHTLQLQLCITTHF